MNLKTHSLLKQILCYINFLKDCHNIYFHKLKSECIYDTKLTNIAANEIFNLTIGA